MIYAKLCQRTGTIQEITENTAIPASDDRMEQLDSFFEKLYTDMKKEENVCRGTATSESLFSTDTASGNVSASSGSRTHHTATYRPDKRQRQ